MECFLANSDGTEDEQDVAGEVIVDSPRAEKSSDTASTTGETSSVPGESSHRARALF